jgi:hypothetical protein
LDQLPDLLRIVLAVAGAALLGFFVRRIVTRRIEQAVAVAQAEGSAARAAVEERLRGREELLAAAREEQVTLSGKLEAAVALDSELRSALASSEARLAEEREQASQKAALWPTPRRSSSTFCWPAGRASKPTPSRSWQRRGRAEVLQSASQVTRAARRRSTAWRRAARTARLL